MNALYTAADRAVLFLWTWFGIRRRWPATKLPPPTAYPLNPLTPCTAGARSAATMVETTSPQPHPYAFLHGNYRDASAWAAEYMRLHGDKLPDEGNLLGWFANAIETQHLNSVEQPYDPAADRPGESLRGDRFRDRMIELLELAHGGFDKDQKETVRIAADQIQNATDLVFHGALTALDDLGDARKRNPCAEFTVRLMLSEIMDHGFVVGELGLLECQNTVVEKVGGTVTTTWLPNGSHCDFERHDPRPNGNSISIGEE